MEAIYYLVGSNIATFILAWIVSRAATKASIYREQSLLEQKRTNTQIWMDFMKAQGGNDE